MDLICVSFVVMFFQGNQMKKWFYLTLLSCAKCCRAVCSETSVNFSQNKRHHLQEPQTQINVNKLLQVQEITAANVRRYYSFDLSWKKATVDFYYYAYCIELPLQNFSSSQCAYSATCDVRGPSGAVMYTEWSVQTVAREAGCHIFMLDFRWVFH
jgi:hypothetical protein